MDQLSPIAASPASRALNQLLHCLLLPPPASAPNPAKPIIDTASAPKKKHAPLPILSRSLPTRRRPGRRRPPGGERTSAAARGQDGGARPRPAPRWPPLPLPIGLSLSLSIPTRTGQRRLAQAGAAAAGALLLLLSPRDWPWRCPPASLAPDAASSLCSVCVHVLQVLQETLAACARGRGGPTSSQPPAAVPSSSVDALASDSSGDWQVVVPPATAWPTR